MNHSHTTSAYQDLNGSGSTTLAKAIADQIDHLSNPHGSHSSDAGLMKDHSQLLDLFPLAGESGTVVALNGGSWFDPGTWSTGKVPQDGQDVYIPFGVSVVVDGVSNANLDTVGVDGGLHFAVDVDTRLKVDTLLTGPSSAFTVGTDDNPVQEGVSAEIIIHRDNGSINRSEDPGELSKGVVTHGHVEMAGQDKVDHLKASVNPEAGDNFLIFDGPVTGWEAGDKLVVAGTRLLGENSFEDEVVTVKSIQSIGNGQYRVNLDQTLKYDHIPPEVSNGEVLQVPVANYTRNVFIGTESDNYLGDGKTVPIDERGHVMFMHNKDVSVKNVEFFELGRTDKSEKLDDADNVAGRYALHFHRTGGDADEEPAVAEGNAVWGSPGWGIVHHDAHLDVVSNAVFGVNGGAIIAESGNETGVWADNITIQTTGDYVTLNSEHGNSLDHPAARTQLLNDSFHQGIGYGFKSRLIETTDNIAVSSNAAGYSFWPMGTEGPSHIYADPADYEAVNGYDPFFGQDEVRPSEIPIRSFSGNESLVSHVGFNTSADKRPSETDVVSVIEDLTVWESVTGVLGFYQRGYLIKDSTFVGVQDSSKTENVVITDTAGVISREFHEVKLVNNHFENYDIGIYEASHNSSEEFVHVILGNTYRDVGTEQRLDIDNSAGPDAYVINDDSSDWMKSVDVGRLDASVNYGASDLSLSEWWDHFTVVVNKTDSIGSQRLEVGSEKGRHGGADQKHWWGEHASNVGYYVDGGTYYLVVQVVTSDRVTGTVGVLEVPVALDFIDGPGDLPNGAKNLGRLPSDLGEFKIVDERKLGESGNLLDPVKDSSDRDDSDSEHGDHGDMGDGGDHGDMGDGGDHGDMGDGGDHGDMGDGGDHGDMGDGGDHGDMGDGGDHGDMGDGGDHGDMGDGGDHGDMGDGGDHGDMGDTGDMGDMGDMGDTGDTGDTGGTGGTGGTPTGEEVLAVDGSSTFEGKKFQVLNFAHSDAFAVSGADISLSFNASSLDGVVGLISKEALDFTSGSHHLSAYLKHGGLRVEFETAQGRVSFSHEGLVVGEEYDLDISFGSDGVRVLLNGEVIGEDPDFAMTWENNTEYLQVGALGLSDSGSSEFVRMFKGTISNVQITATDGIGDVPDDTPDQGDTVAGGSGNDSLEGTGDEDLITGRGGDDTIQGSEQADSLVGGADNDSILGAGGDDTIRGETGDDYIRGNAGNDTLKGGHGNDEILGDRGSDTIKGGKDNDKLYGGKGADHISGGTEDDRLYGGNGADTLWGGIRRRLFQWRQRLRHHARWRGSGYALGWCHV